MDKLYVAYGDNALLMTSLLLEKTEPEAGLNRDAKILIKPNLVVPKPWQSGATTNPAVAEAVIIYLKERGFGNLIIAEGSWLGANTISAFKACGYESLSKKYDISLFDTKHDEFITRSHKGYDFEICETAFQADLVINLPVIKGHCQTDLTCALKNLKGIISDKEKRRFHSLGLHIPIAYLNTLFKNVFTIADGIYGDIDYEEGGNPIKMDIMLASFDRVKLDSYAATLLSYNPSDIEYISKANDEGVGDMSLDSRYIEYLNEPTLTNELKHSSKITILKKYIDEDMACSACVGNLIRALYVLDVDGALGSLEKKISVGQGFKSKETLLGIGRCACKDGLCINCPPTSLEISNYLKNKI
jgi:uncharacterized protein (DUF362 family)